VSINPARIRAHVRNDRASRLFFISVLVCIWLHESKFSDHHQTTQAHDYTNRREDHELSQSRDYDRQVCAATYRDGDQSFLEPSCKLRTDLFVFSITLNTDLPRFRTFPSTSEPNGHLDKPCNVENRLISFHSRNNDRTIRSHEIVSDNLFGTVCTISYFQSSVIDVYNRSRSYDLHDVSALRSVGNVDRSASQAKASYAYGFCKNLYAIYLSFSLHQIADISDTV